MEVTDQRIPIHPLRRGSWCKGLWGRAEKALHRSVRELFPGTSAEASPQGFRLWPYLGLFQATWYVCGDIYNILLGEKTHSQEQLIGDGRWHLALCSRPIFCL